MLPHERTYHHREQASKVRTRRDKRAIVVTQRDQYELKSTNGAMTPVGRVAKMLMKAVLAAKNKTESDSKP